MGGEEFLSMMEFVYQGGRGVIIIYILVTVKRFGVKEGNNGFTLDLTAHIALEVTLWAGCACVHVLAEVCFDCVWFFALSWAMCSSLEK